MKEDKFLILFENVADEYILEANPNQTNHTKQNFIKYVSLAACICLVLISSITGRKLYNSYYTETSYIGIDVNPSIELCLNKYDKVIDTIAYNDDGTKIIDNLNLKNKTCDDALSLLLSDQDFTDYLKTNKEISITIASDSKNKLETTIENCFKEVTNTKNLCHTDIDTRNNAHKEHCSTKKYMLYQELKEYDSSVTIDACNNMTVHELNQKLNTCKHLHSSEKHKPSKKTDCNPNNSNPQKHHSDSKIHHDS